MINQLFLNLQIQQLVSKVRDNQGYQTKNAAPATEDTDLVTLGQLKAAAGKGLTVNSGNSGSTINNNTTINNNILTVQLVPVISGGALLNFKLGNSFRTVVPHGAVTILSTTGEPTGPLMWLLVIDQDSTGGGSTLFQSRFKNMPVLASPNSPALTRCTQLMFWDGVNHYPIPQLDQPI